MRTTGLIVFATARLLLAEDRPPSIIAHSVDGTQHAGALDSWSVPGKLVVRSASGDLATIESADLDHVEFRDPQPMAVPPRRPTGEWVIQLRDGSRWFAEITGGDEQSVVVRHPALGEQKLAIDAISRLLRHSSGSDRPAAAGDDDTAVLMNGDTVRGTIARLSAEGLALSVGGGQRRFAWKDIRAIVPAATDEKSTGGIKALVELTDGTQFLADSLAWKAPHFQVTTAAGLRAALPSGDVPFVEISGGRRVWLGEIKPSRYTSTPYFSKTWPLRVDENVMGGPLRIAGTSYRRGLGLHAACTTTWKLEGRYGRFRAAVGMDDSAGSLADADVMVSLDGRVVAEHRQLVAGQTPKPIDVDISGAKELTIEIGFGKNGHVQDRVDLVNAALIAK